MPKIGKTRIAENRRALESAALSLFTAKGFHGTNIREIAEKAGLSVGAMYSYYPNKEALFVGVVHRSEQHLSDLRAKMFLNADDEPFSRRALRTLAEQIRLTVYDNADYWRLMYIDVLEFHNEHFADKFQNLAEQFRERLREQFGRTVQHPDWCGQEPGFVYANFYLNVMTYFLIEKLFGGDRHLGVSDKEAMEQIVDLYSRGLWSRKLTSDQRQRSSKQATIAGPAVKKARTIAVGRKRAT